VSNKRKKRKELEHAVNQNDFAMASVVKMKMSINSLFGGDYVGDCDAAVAREQFVHTSAKADLGWCLGVHVVAMVARVLKSPEKLQSFKNSVMNFVDEELDEYRDEIEKIDNPETNND
jgi:hypothetical protein